MKRAAVIAGLVVVALGILGQELPPLPGVLVRFIWDPNDPADQVTGYYLHQATNLAGPWTIVGSTNGTNYALLLPRKGQWFFYVTASNFWGMSEPSNIVTTPREAARVEGTKIGL